MNDRALELSVRKFVQHTAERFTVRDLNLNALSIFLVAPGISVQFMK